LSMVEDTELRDLAKAVVGGGASEPFGAYVFGPDEPGAFLGRYLEREVFLESFGNTLELLTEEYAQYERSSMFIVVIDHLRYLPAGVIRVIKPSISGFKSLNDLKPVWGETGDAMMERTGLTFPPDRIWDVATLAVPPDYRAKATQGLVAMGLYQTLSLAARDCGVDLLVTILDMPVFRMLRWKLHLIFAGYRGVGPQPYLGSAASMPAWCDLASAERHLAEAAPEMHEILTQGIGLEPALRLADLSRLSDDGYLGDIAAAS